MSQRHVALPGGGRFDRLADGDENLPVYFPRHPAGALLVVRGDGGEMAHEFIRALRTGDEVRYRTAKLAHLVYHQAVPSADVGDGIGQLNLLHRRAEGRRQFGRI
jgi:hypothetical protein